MTSIRKVFRISRKSYRNEKHKFDKYTTELHGHLSIEELNWWEFCITTNSKCEIHDNVKHLQVVAYMIIQINVGICIDWKNMVFQNHTL